MKKRIIAAICLFAVILCAVALGQKGEATTDRYLVGYGIRDINPWVDPNDHSQGVLPVELTGNGNNWERACTGFMDDNDDGVVGEGDGIFTTATAVTDPYGETMFYITIDSLQGYSNVTADVRNALAEQLGVKKNHVMVNGNHTHSGPYFGGLKTSSNEQFKAYYQYVVQQIIDAAVEAYNDRAEAVMTKGTINATESTAYLGYNSGKGYHMNAIRHYDVVSQLKTSSATKKEHVAGSNFGGMSTTMSKYKQVSKTNALESDNTMYVLLFAFPDNAEKEPIIFVNWRAHSTTNSGGTNKTFVSGDYANSIRANMKKAGYRAAFFQGASGNVVTKSTQLNDWAAECYPEYGNYNANTNIYGRILTNIALDCVERKMTDELPAGEIRTIQITYNGEKQQDSEGYLAAAQAYQAASAELGENKFVTTPYSYTHTDGKTYIINSKFHASSIITRSKASASYTQLELNAIIMGGNVAFVTAPNEMADRFDLAGSTKNEDNDWYELITEEYGMPFVLGYTNDGKGYIPFSLEYAYNTDEYYEITGKGANGDEFFAPGSYESNTSRFERGTGEAIVQKMKQMLGVLSNEPRVAYCEACEKEVEWTPLIAEQANNKNLGTGHYYLIEDQKAGARAENQKLVSAGETLCYDLNGYTVEAQGRNFHVSGSGATLNIMDSAGGGKVVSYSGGNNVGGGVILSGGGTRVNIYGGTLQFIRTDVAEGVYETGNGGVISAGGTVNMYGGTMIGGELLKSSYYADTVTTNGCGATVFLSGTLNVYGGKILSGKAAEGACGDCIYLKSGAKLSVTGDARIDDIFFAPSDTSKCMEITGVYTGTAGLTFQNAVSNGQDIGAATNANIAGATLTCNNDSAMNVIVSGDDLLLSKTSESTVALWEGSQGKKPYSSLEEAVNDYTDGLITLLKDDDSSVHITNDTYIDLNGCDVRGELVVDETATLYCKDSKTDDFTVEDDDYGCIIEVYGNISGLQNEAGSYMVIAEDEGVSLHRVELSIQAMTLRPQVNGVYEPSVYYKSYFAGDEKVAEYVDTFGVALSVKEMPDAQNMETVCKYSWYQGFASGEGANDASSTGVLLKGIMKGRNSDTQNAKNAATPVYGRAYIKDKEGNYIFSAGVSRCLQEEIELIDQSWADLGESKAGVVALYREYLSVMETWNVPNIRNANYNDDLVFTSGDQAYCPVCEKEVAWTAITQETCGETALGVLSGTGLHYYLAEDITYSGADNFIQGPGSYGTLCLHLNGHDFTGTQSQFLFGYGSQSSIMGNGTVYNGKNSALSGGIIWNTGYTGNVSAHLYGGTYTVTPENTKGSAISIQNNGGVVYIHEGAKVIGSATAPAIYVGTSNLRTSELYITGAAVEGSIQIKNRATAKGKATTILLEDAKVSAVELGTDVSFTVAGDTVIDKLTVTTGAKLTVGDLTEHAMITLAGDGVVSEANANMAAYLGCFKPCSGELAIENDALVLSE